jgi:hypothetical protein
MAGFATEYKPVYNNQLNVYRGIDNVLEFKILNADQKPIDLLGKTINFIAFDENKNLIITRSGVNSSIKGLVTVTINDSDTLSLKDQYLSYNITIVDDVTSVPTLTYSSSHFAQEGIIKLSSEAYPGPKISNIVSSFVQEETAWYSNLITAEPGINGNEALHTIAIYTDAYTGRIDIQATLDNDISDPAQINWVDVTNTVFTGTETEPRIINFNGVFNYLRFAASANPADKITKILVRN